MNKQEENKRNDFTTFKRLMQQALPFKKLFISALLAGVLLAIVAPIRPFLIQKIIDDYIIHYNKIGLRNLSLLLIVILFTESLLRYLFNFATAWLGQSVIKDIRVKVFKHIQSLKPQFFDKTPIGTATTRTISDVEAINNTFSQGIIAIITDVLTLIFVIVFMLVINWKIALISLSTFPLLIIATYIFKEKVRAAFHIVREKVSQMNAFLQERITGMRIIQLFNVEKKEYQKFEKINKAHRNANLRSVWYYSIFFPVVEIILALAIGLMVWFGANEVLNEKATLGIFTSFLLYLNMAFRPLRMLADKFNTLQMGIVASERVFKILDLDEMISNNGTIKNIEIDGDLRFQHVWFAYNEENYVLKDISFEINKGETIAFVGATGSGKTSIINLLNRFYNINKGEIFLDNKHIEDYDLTFLRSRISVVLQDVFLFSGSIAENISINNNSISEEKIIEAAKIIGADLFIESLPGSYDYNVMERGATLSVGQRQLISFIRALVYDPDILILDEATSSVDTESEQLIQHAIDKLINGRTAIIIAHRLSTIKKADKIIVLDKGEIKEIGNHQSLLKIQGGYYRTLYEMQFKEEKNALDDKLSDN